MNIDAILTAFKHELRNLEWPGETLERLSTVTRRSSADGDMNFVSAFGLNASNADAAIQTELKHFKSLGREFEWKVFSFDEPTDLRQHLEAAGFEVSAPEAVVIYDLNDGLDTLGGDFDCEVQRIERMEQLADFRLLAEDVFGKDYSFTANQLAEAIASDNQGHVGYTGYVNGEPASVGRLYTNPASKFAGLYGGGTRKQFRGKGCYRAMIASRAKDALEQGARYLQVDALPTSEPILRRLGFQKIAETWPAHPIRPETLVP